MGGMISVITCCYNDCNNLIVTYKSLVRQNVAQFEWIVVDGGSLDDTAEWLKSIENDKFKISWVSERDKGIADAWNKGISICSGDWVIILNAGDTFYPDTISNLSEIQQFNMIICCHADLLDRFGRKIGVIKAAPNKLRFGMYTPHNWCLVPKRFYEREGLYPLLDHSMDFAWFHMVYKKYGCEIFTVVDFVGGTYSMGGHSDKNYISSFLQNRRIMLQSGEWKVVANVIFLIGVIKHFIYRLARIFKER